MDQLLKIKSPEEKNPECIEEPKPGPNHLYCAVCKEQFKEYYAHIFSQTHKNNVKTGRNNDIFTEIDITIKEVNESSDKKDYEIQ